MKQNKTILFCPLDWGLGHASRSVFYIQKLLDKGYRIIIAADNAPLTLLQKEFPDLDRVRFPSFYKIRYPKFVPMQIMAPFYFLKIVIGSVIEHVFLKKLIKKCNPEIIVSDNRFGLWNKHYFTIYITHQISIRMPAWAGFIEKPVYKLHKKVINKYDQCWIPDKKGSDNLSGNLSHKFPVPSNAVFTGIASRFLLPRNIITEASEPYDIIVVLSGPEPQRTILEEKLLSYFHSSNEKVFFLRGKPGDKELKINTTKMANHLPSAEIRLLLAHAKTIICRPGYSMLMDLAALNKKALLIPTPGQTEQEYLGWYMNKCGRHLVLAQNNINNLPRKIKELHSLNPKPFKQNSRLFDESVILPSPENQ